MQLYILISMDQFIHGNFIGNLERYYADAFYLYKEAFKKTSREIGKKCHEF